MNRKTLTIIAAAGALVAAAIILGTGAHTGGKSVTATPTGIPPRAMCGKATPAKASADFGPGTMTASLSSTRVLQGGDGEIFLVVDLSARDAVAGTRAPMNVAIVIDRSGSMQGEKLARAREAAHGLVARLSGVDRVALIQYDDSAQVLVPATAADDVGKSRLYAAIDSISDGGSTNLHDGLVLGRDQVLGGLAPGRVNRVILLSDGQANVGVTDTASLARVASDASEKGVRISTIGLGVDYNEDLMEALGREGRGQYYYVRDASGLETVFAGELRALQSTVATAAELRLEPACDGTRVLDVYGHTFRRDGNAVVVALADLSGGDQRKVVVRLQVPALRVGAEAAVVATLSFAPAAGGDRRQVATAVGVEVSADVAVVDHSVDAPTLAKVEQVQTATSVRKAAEAYDRGDQQGALQIISNQRAQSQAHASKYGMSAGAMAPTMDTLGQAESGMAAAPAATPAGMDAKKGAKAAARVLEQ